MVILRHGRVVAEARAREFLPLPDGSGLFEVGGLSWVPLRAPLLLSLLPVIIIWKLLYKDFLEKFRC